MRFLNTWWRGYLCSKDWTGQAQAIIPVLRMICLIVDDITEGERLEENEAGFVRYSSAFDCWGQGGNKMWQERSEARVGRMSG